MQKKILSIILGIALLLVAEQSKAGSWDLNKVFQGMSANVTSAQSFKDGASGYYTGGGLAIRVPNNTHHPFGLTPPHIKAGCGGIDIYMGGFEMMKGDQMVRVCRNIGAQAVSFAFQLGLKTLSPMVENLFSHLRDTLNEMSQFGISECQAAASALTSMLPADTKSREFACQEMKRFSDNTDYFGARKGCANDEEKNAALRDRQRASNNEELFDGYNLLVVAAGKAGVPEDMIETLLTACGTVIKDKVTISFASLMKEEKSFNALVEGGAGIKEYKCNDGVTKCLDMKEQERTLNRADSFLGKIEKKMTDMRQKMLNNTPFTQEEKDLIAGVGESLPIYKALTIEAATKVGHLRSAALSVATMILTKFILSSIDEVRKSMKTLQGKQYDSSTITNFILDLDQVETRMLERQAKVSKEMRRFTDRLEKGEKYMEQLTI